MSLTYDGFCCAAGLRKTSTNSEILAVQELIPIQIGRRGGKESKSAQSTDYLNTSFQMMVMMVMSPAAEPSGCPYVTKLQP